MEQKNFRGHDLEKQTDMFCLNGGNSYSFIMLPWCVNFLSSILIALITSSIPVILSNGSVVYTSVPFYISLVVIFAYVMCFKGWGFFSGFLTFLICALLQNLSVANIAVNVGINMLQLGIIYGMYYMLKHKLPFKNMNKYAEGMFYLSPYNLFLIICFIAYIAYITTDNIHSPLFFVVLLSMGVVLIIGCIVQAIIYKDFRLVLYMFLIAFFPSFFCSYLSSEMSPDSQVENWKGIILWGTSNFILLQTCGYIIYQILYIRESRGFTGDKICIKAESLVYYVAITIWNILILSFIKTPEVYADKIYVFFFPWALGNLFMGANLSFSFCNEEVDNRFKWIENRIIVIEKNISSIITIISFMLPLCVTMGEDIVLPSQLFSLFIANIFCACISVGLIWIPNQKIRFISLLHALKTVFFIYSITLLLVTIIIIMLCYGMTIYE